MGALPKAPGFRLDGRRALVTGAGRGLGMAAAAALAEQGAHVVLAARTSADIEALADAIRADGGAAEALLLDVSDTGAVRAAIDRSPPFDILVNNAGINKPEPFAAVSTGNYDAIFDLNVRAAFFVAQAVVQKLLEAGMPGSIIHVSSQMGHVGAPNRTVYCASKHALEGLSKAMAVELGPHGIRVNTIAPTFVETPMTAPFFANEDFRRYALSHIKLGRLGKYEDIMSAVVFLASDASALVTGSSLKIDGGWTAE